MNRIELNKWTDLDLSDLVLHGNNPNIAKFLMNRFPFPYTLEEGQKFIQSVSVQIPTQIFCIRLEQKAIGAIGVHPQNDIYQKNAELGYWLSEKYWGRGIITEAITQIIEYSFSTFDINRLFARPFGSNIASQKVLEKCGFLLEAKLHSTIFKNNQYEDELIYALRRK
ncbi:MAG: GNAT family N-acetyltransferase [Saprospiraceae bacterium]|nr:GNAT family N-acetyltransferase [Saprospiraceae bacterium]